MEHHNLVNGGTVVSNPFIKIQKQLTMATMINSIVGPSVFLFLIFFRLTRPTHQSQKVKHKISHVLILPSWTSKSVTPKLYTQHTCPKLMCAWNNLEHPFAFSKWRRGSLVDYMCHFDRNLLDYLPWWSNKLAVCCFKGSIFPVMKIYVIFVIINFK